MNDKTPWEHGSAFPLDPMVPTGDSWLPGHSELYGSGRDALRAVISVGKRAGWRRLHIPYYYCHDVTAAIMSEIDVCFYSHHPLSRRTQLVVQPDEAVLVVEYFGAPAQVEVQGGHLILDRTHDPAATHRYDREADYIVASLRKVLPLPDGGIAWSSGRGEPPPPTRLTPHHARSATVAMSGMALKAAYLAGHAVSKEQYLAELADAERSLIRSRSISGSSRYTSELAKSMALQELLRRKSRNLTVVAHYWDALPGIRLLRRPAYAVFLIEGEGRRDLIRKHLIEQRVYPAIHWPLNTVAAPAEERHLSSTILALHADYRYDGDDMRAALDALMAAAERYPHAG